MRVTPSSILRPSLSLLPSTPSTLSCAQPRQISLSVLASTMSTTRVPASCSDHSGRTDVVVMAIPGVALLADVEALVDARVIVNPHVWCFGGGRPFEPASGHLLDRPST